MTEESRYESLGLMVGLELHQQLNTEQKLFCHCPTLIRESEPHGSFVRRLRPTRSEMGEVDPAALFEFQKKKKFCYEYYNDTTCLVEADEEPPHDLCDEAIDICLTMANFLGSNPVDEVHPMRKIVIDGSNTTGFQRTAIVSLGGEVIVGEKRIGIQAIAVEEDAARKIADDDKNNMRVYRLDRLGIPLIEIATAPDIRTPEEAQEVAFAIGMLLRATGRVKRGQGTIRQDVNVSIKEGAIMEIKGLQQLDMLAATVEFEALRQEELLKIRDELVARGISSGDVKEEIVDVTRIFDGSESKVIKNATKTGGSVYGVCLPGFAGLVGREIQPERRLGSELSDYAKFWGGVGGIFHTDELPKYGITEDDVDSLRKILKAKQQDAVVIVAASGQDCQSALEAVVKRAREAVIGVPAETRMPLPNGTSKYARPRPGAQRMYPETDVRPVKITAQRLKRIKKGMPETLEKKEERFIKDHGLSSDLASQIVRSLYLDLYEFIIAEVKISPTLVAVTLENTLVSLHREGVEIGRITEKHFEGLFRAVADNKVAPQAIPSVLTHLANNPASSIENALKATGLGIADQDEVKGIIKKIVSERIDFIREQGDRAVGGLMGVVMNELRGKADGKTVKDLLTTEVNKVLSE
ncbi:MAG: Glu-tRNA(Gln) amidotransferase subunit GatE [Candidatus Thorarchaeota archaeon]|nr:Glu-tRNA(Gln) amidotransferase subunit GatE [Candidatus Thorarchaeota archaeon]